MSSWDDFLAPSVDGDTDGSDEAGAESGYAAVEAELAEQAAALEALEADLAGEAAHLTDFGDLLADGDSDYASEAYVAEVEAELQASAEEAALDLVSDGDAYGDGDGSY